MHLHRDLGNQFYISKSKFYSLELNLLELCLRKSFSYDQTPFSSKLKLLFVRKNQFFIFIFVAWNQFCCPSNPRYLHRDLEHHFQIFEIFILISNGIQLFIEKSLGFISFQNRFVFYGEAISKVIMALLSNITKNL